MTQSSIQRAASFMAALQSDAGIALAVHIQQQGEIAFSLEEMAKAQLLMVKVMLKSRENKT